MRMTLLGPGCDLVLLPGCDLVLLPRLGQHLQFFLREQVAPRYMITAGTDIIVPGISDTGNHCVWCETVIPLPFPFVLYDQTFTAVNVTSSGRLDFLCLNEPAGYTESCLPAVPNNCPYDYTIFALWAEWATLADQAGCSTWATGCGIFTSISGTTPNRIFNIEWRVVFRQNVAQTGNFEVRLYENDPTGRFDVIYGVITGITNFDSAGVQGLAGFFTGDFCLAPPPQNTSRTYQLQPCGTPTPTATPRFTPAPRTKSVVSKGIGRKTPACRA